MQNTAWFWIALISIAALVAIGIVFVPSYIQTKIAQAELQATIKAQDKVIADADARMAAREKDADAKVKFWQDQAAKVKTPVQAVNTLPQVVELPKPIFLPGPDTLPNSPGAAVIPAESVVPLYQHLAECRENDILLGTCQANRKDTDDKIAALTLQRDAAVKASKHGFWDKFKNCAARAGVGAASGGLSGNPKLAGAGAAIGVSSCFIIQ